MRSETAINLAAREASLERNKHPTILNFDASLNFRSSESFSLLNKLFNNRNLRREMNFRSWLVMLFYHRQK